MVTPMRQDKGPDIAMILKFCMVGSPHICGEEFLMCYYCGHSACPHISTRTNNGEDMCIACYDRFQLTLEEATVSPPIAGDPPVRPIGSSIKLRVVMKEVAATIP